MYYSCAGSLGGAKFVCLDIRYTPYHGRGGLRSERYSSAFEDYQSGRVVYIKIPWYYCIVFLHWVSCWTDKETDVLITNPAVRISTFRYRAEHTVYFTTITSIHNHVSVGAGGGGVRKCY